MKYHGVSLEMLTYSWIQKGIERFYQYRERLGWKAWIQKGIESVPEPASKLASSPRTWIQKGIERYAFRSDLWYESYRSWIQKGIESYRVPVQPSHQSPFLESEKELKDEGVRDKIHEFFLNLNPKRNWKLQHARLRKGHSYGGLNPKRNWKFKGF